MSRHQKVHEFINKFRELAIQRCMAHEVRGLVGIPITDIEGKKLSLSFHMHGHVVYLNLDHTTYMEQVYNKGTELGRDYQNIKIATLYDKLYMLLRDGELNSIDLEKTILQLL
jgi:hypothetical protein